MTHMYTIDHPRITGYLRNYDPIKLYFRLLPYNDTSRPMFVPQEYLIHFDDSLLPCNVPTIIEKPLDVIKHIVFAPLNDKEKPYYKAPLKQAYSYSELMFISAQVIAFMVKAEKTKSDIQNTTHGQYTPKQPTTTTDKLNNHLTSRTLRDLPSGSPLATLTLILDCYEHTLKVLQSLDIDSDRITSIIQSNTYNT